MLKNKKGFTLIELLVVIAIIGILSAIVLASLTTARTKAQDAKVQSQMSSIRTAAEIAYDGSSYGLATGANSCSGLIEADPVSTLMEDTNWSDGVAPSCTSDAAANGPITAYSMWHSLSDTAANSFWCVDSTGASIGIDDEPGTGEDCVGNPL